MPVLICLREKIWTRTYSKGDQVPTCPVFTRAKIKSRFGNFSQKTVTMTLWSFTPLRVLFHTLIFSNWGLNNSKSPQVSRTPLGIQADLYNAVVWMVSTRLLIWKSSSPCVNLLVTVSSVPVAIYKTVNFMSHSFFSSRARFGSYVLFHFSSVIPCGRLKR